MCHFLFLQCIWTGCVDTYVSIKFQQIFVRVWQLFSPQAATEDPFSLKYFRDAYWSTICNSEDLFWTHKIFIGLSTVWVKRTLGDYLLLSIHLTLEETEEKNIISTKRMPIYSSICWLLFQCSEHSLVRRQGTQICLQALHRVAEACPSQPLWLHPCVVTEIAWRQCCRRSLRGCDRRLTLKLGPDNPSLPPLSLKYTFFPLFPQWEPFFINEALRDQWVFETIWTEYVSESH